MFVLLLNSYALQIFFYNFNIMTCVVCWQQVAQLSQHKQQEAVAKEGGKLYLGTLRQDFTLFFREAVESFNVKIGLRMAFFFVHNWTEIALNIFTCKGGLPVRLFDSSYSYQKPAGRPMGHSGLMRKQAGLTGANWYL